MLLKRITDPAGHCTGVQVKHTGLKPQQNFSHRLVEQGILEGWIQIEGDTLTIRAEPEDLRYHLQRRPGYYCRSSRQRIPISETAWVRKRSTGVGDISRREAQAWLAAHAKKLDDYEVTEAYECALETALHQKYRAVRARSGMLVAASAQE